MQHIVIVSTTCQNTVNDVDNGQEMSCSAYSYCIYCMSEYRAWCSGVQLHTEAINPVSLPTVLTYIHGQEQGKEQKQNILQATLTVCI